MGNLVLDYAVKFSQIESLPGLSFDFLHSIAVCVPNEISASSDIRSPEGTETAPAVIDFEGFAWSGLSLSCDITEGSETYTASLSIDSNQSPANVAELFADVINELDAQVSAFAIANFIEVSRAGTEDILLENLTISGTSADLIEITSKDDLILYSPSHAYEVDGIFDGGLNKVTLILLDDIEDLAEKIVDKETDFFTLHNSSAFDTNDFLDQTTGWGGVVGFSDISLANCEDNANTSSVCAFFHNESVKDSYKSLYAFGSLLASTFWRNQQYISTSDDTGAITDLGEAESLFASRVSFFLSDTENGTRLGFFVAGGKSITTPYISKEIELQIQYEHANYLTVNQPYNVALDRSELSRIANKEIKGYLDLGYLDPDGENIITITDSNETFVVNGNLTTSPAVALWRVAIDSYQTQG